MYSRTADKSPQIQAFHRAMRKYSSLALHLPLILPTHTHYIEHVVEAGFDSGAVAFFPVAWVEVGGGMGDLFGALVVYVALGDDIGKDVGFVAVELVGVVLSEVVYQ